MNAHDKTYFHLPWFFHKKLLQHNFGVHGKKIHFQPVSCLRFDEGLKAKVQPTQHDLT